VLQNTCSEYLDVAANDGVDSLNVTQLSVLTQPVNGTAFQNGDFITYCPTQGYSGSDQFQYSITANGEKDTATVYINVLPPNNIIFTGDADQNGTVEHFDVLAVGLSYGLSGPSRSSVNALAWQPTSFINSNPGAADCNGDGRVDVDDIALIDSSYGNIYAVANPYTVDTSSCENNGMPLYFITMTSDTINDGDTLDVVISLGADFSVSEGYGIAFTLETDTGWSAVNQVEFFSNNSWLVASDSSHLFYKRTASPKEIKIALSRTDHNLVSGYGEILRFRVPIDDNIDGLAHAPGWHPYDLSIKEIRLVSEYDIVRTICVQQPSLVVNKNANAIETDKIFSVKIYPNPTSGTITIEGSGLQQIDITDLAGRKIHRTVLQKTNNATLNVNGVSAGSYLVFIKANDITTVQKIFIQP
jgi:hypothetical protein